MKLEWMVANRTRLDRMPGDPTFSATFHHNGSFKIPALWNVEKRDTGEWGVFKFGNACK